VSTLTMNWSTVLRVSLFFVSFMVFRLLSFQAHIERTKLILDQLLEEENDDFLAVESKYEKVSCELYNKEIENPNDICELQEIP
jgi:hypothetical protein